MAVSYVGASAWVFGTGSVTPALPGGLAAGDYVIINLFSKYDNATLTAEPDGWTALGTAISSGRSTGTDNGNMRSRCFGKVWQSGDSMPLLNPTPNNVSGVNATAFRSATGAYDVQAVCVDDSTTGSPLSSGSQALSVANGDWVLGSAHMNGDVATFSSASMTMTGATATGTNSTNTSTTSGTDARVRSDRYQVTAGSASAATYSITLGGTTTNATGTMHIVRVREAVVATNLTASAVASGEAFGSPALTAIPTLGPTAIDAPGGGAPSAITHVATTSSGNASQVSSSKSVAVPAGVQAGDVVLLSIDTFQDGGTYTPPTGFTLIHDTSFASDRVATWWKRLTGADSGNYTVTGLGSGIWSSLMASAFRGCRATGDPFEDTDVVTSFVSSPPPVSVVTTGQTWNWWRTYNSSTASTRGMPVNDELSAYTQRASFDCSAVADKDDVPSGTRNIFGATDNAGTTDRLTIAVALVPDPGGGGDAFGEPTVSEPAGPETQTLTTTAIASAQALGSPTGQASLTVTASAVGSQEALGSPTRTSLLTLSPAAIASAQALGSPTRTSSLTVTAAGIASAQAIGTHALQELNSPQFLTAIAIASAQALGAASVSTSLSLAATGIASAAAMGSPVASLSVALLPGGIASASAVPGPTMSAVVVVAPQALASAEAIPGPSVTSFSGLAPVGIASQEALGLPALSGMLVLLPTGIASGQGLGTPGANFAMVLGALGIASGQALGSPSTTHRLTVGPSPLATAEAFGTVALMVDRMLAPAAISSAAAFGTAVVAFSLTASPTSVATQEALGVPSVNAMLLVVPSVVLSGEAVGEPAVVILVTVTTAGIGSEQGVGSPDLVLFSGAIIAAQEPRATLLWPKTTVNLGGNAEATALHGSGGGATIDWPDTNTTWERPNG